MLTKEQIYQLFNDIAKDINGVLNINEFVTTFKKQFPKIPILALEGLFRFQDTNGNETINFMEFLSLIRFIEHHKTIDTFELMFYYCDFEGNEMLNEDVFCLLWKCLYPEEDDMDKIYETFKKFDSDGDTYVTFEEYKELIETLKNELNEN